MEERILFVDDEENILAAYQRQLRKQFQIETASGGVPALEAIISRGPYAIVVSDMRMPGMDGIQLLSRVREKAPDTVRMMLTGNHDVQTAMQAVNEGSIFRFLTKPCPPESLAQALTAGLRQYRLLTSEHVLLEQTLSGSVCVLTEILSLIDPHSFGRAEILKDNVRIVAGQMGVVSLWELEIAALLSQIGMVTVPGPVISKLRTGFTLAGTEQVMVTCVPEIGRNLLANIPRLEPVANIVFYQNKHFDGTGFPKDAVAGCDIPLGSRIIKVTSDLLHIERKGIARVKAFYLMKQREGWYDPRVLDTAVACLVPLAQTEDAVPAPSHQCAVKDLQPGQVLVSPVQTRDGRLLLAAGHRLTSAALVRIRNIAEYSALKEPILVQGQSKPGS